MQKIPFQEEELQIAAVKTSNRGTFHLFSAPVTYGENYRLAYEEKMPVFEPIARGVSKDFCPKVIPDNVARAFVASGENFPNRTAGGGKDMFGMEWELCASGGSMIRPGSPALKDANDWKNVIQLPDVDSWDWAGSVEANKEFLQGSDWLTMTLLSGAWFERLISFMDFEGAVTALVDEDQQDAVHELFDATTGVLMQVVDKICEYFPMIRAITVHDDWGSQANPFFSQDTAMEMIVPHMKKLTDYIKSKGKIAVLHSCGHTEKRIEAYIAAGWQSWNPQTMNDTPRLYDEYGDKILLTVNADGLTEGMSDAEQEEYAKQFCRRFCKPGKPSMCSYDTKFEAFEKALYKYSRLAYMGEEF